MASDATNQALANVQNYKQVSSTDALNQANTNYDVGGSQARLSALKGIVGNLTSAVEAVDPSVTGRTAGTFTTEGQRSALVNREQAPILSNLNKANASYSDEQGQLTQKQTLAAQMTQALLNDDQKAYQKLLDQYNASTARDQSDEQKRQFEVQQAESQRQFNETLKANAAKASTSSSAASTKASNTASLISDVKDNVADFRSRPAGWTEKTLIPQLIAAYPEIPSKTIIDYVYQLRKQYE